MPAPYESWKVFEKAKRVRTLAGVISRRPPRGLSTDIDHLRRGASSVIYNLSEGAGRYAKADKINFYRIALGSANECNTALNVLIADSGEQPILMEAKTLTGEVTAMLIGLIKSIENRPD